MGDPKQTAKCIPQLIWVIIKSLRFFYSTVCTRDDLTPEDSDLPCLPTASLDAYTFLLKAELPIEVDGIPDQWLPAHKRPTPTPTTATPKPASQNDNQSRQQTQNPFNPSSTTGRWHNPYMPKPAHSVCQQQNLTRPQKQAGMSHEGAYQKSRHPRRPKWAQLNDPTQKHLLVLPLTWTVPLNPKQ